jgi:hypothetical protein
MPLSASPTWGEADTRLVALSYPSIYPSIYPLGPLTER